MKNKISVNILIPAYNAEKTIVNCLQSVFEQDYDNIQIIIINDGSTDSTDKLLKEISVEHKNIKVLKQTNHGLAYTRKALIDKASADYLVNLDADDTLTDKYSISNLINASHNGQDQMVCGKRNLVKDNKTRSLFIGSCFSKRANIKKYSFRTLGFCTGILISTKFIQKHFNFDIHYGCAEDRMLMFSISPYIERFSAINKYVYNYFVNSDSMTHSSKHYRICNED
jgi:glycosyltransferase involved in cell wall biosynthesis